MKQRAKNKFNVNIITTVAGEMIAGHGEDSYAYHYANKKGFVGVFDGCGGTGGKSYNAYGGYTGAYIASRVAAVSMLEWWKAGLTQALPVESLKSLIEKRLKTLKEKDTSAEQTGMLKGSLSKKDFPTTASAVTFDFTATPTCNFLWAGDSRGYVLDSKGLSQVTKDDVDADVDAFSNIESDARVSNVINAGVDFYINSKTISLNAPAIVFVATDGCFSYYETPMEFEHLMLSTLMAAESVADWEKKLNALLRAQASDDYTLGLIVCGFSRFKDIKPYFAPRYAHLKDHYMAKIKAARGGSQSGGGTVNTLWQEYKETYYRYE